MSRARLNFTVASVLGVCATGVAVIGELSGAQSFTLVSGLLFFILGLQQVVFRESLSEFWGEEGFSERGILISGVCLMLLSILVLILPATFSVL